MTVAVGDPTLSPKMQNTPMQSPFQQTPGDYKACPASATTTCGATGVKGDVLECLVVAVTTSGATGICSIKDGSDAAISVVPVGAPIGTYIFYLNIISRTGAWQIVAGAAATALASGRFT